MCLRFIPTCVGQMLASNNLEVKYLRFIPTCVGQIVHIVTSFWYLTVHPHMRGADIIRPRNSFKNCGSSPHAWGRCIRSPASPVVKSVHPHMRGADGYATVYDDTNYGSSPHAWGRFKGQHYDRWANRFIPTCVGQMSTFRFQFEREAVHPHMRGADNPIYISHLNLTRFIPTCVGQICVVNYCISLRIGSSPHAWGR